MEGSLPENAVIFSTGAVGYGLIEVAFRGITHPSMLLAGGISLISLGAVNRRMRGQPLLFRGVAGSAVITSVELLFGEIFNRLLGLKVWDYSAMPLNFQGQICLPFSLIWGFLSLAAMALDVFLRRRFRCPGYFLQKTGTKSEKAPAGQTV